QEPLTEPHQDMAPSLQAVYETCAFHVLNALWERTNLPSLCLAGGCAMNSVANGKVRTHTPFRQLYVQPAASDNGTALGAAYFLWHQSFGKPRTFVMNHALWGTAYENSDLTSYLSKKGHQGEFKIHRFSDSDEKRHLLPASTHVDGTGRLQTVNRTQNPLYYRLIQEFEKLTGVPVLLNTSFNENEPIVDTPAQALECFLRTKMDGIVAGDT